MKLCFFPECGRALLSKGLCQSHYFQMSKGQELRPIKDQRRLPVVPCTFDGCKRARLTRSGLCGPHRRQQSAGQELRPIKERNQPCDFERCDRKAVSYGLCDPHSAQRKRGMTLKPIHVPTYRYGHVGGYVLLKDPSHFAAGKNGRLLEHVKVMADHLGRPLVDGENVHHINGVRDDNRLENLELWNTHQPKGQRVPDKVAWAVEILRLYDPSLLR